MINKPEKYLDDILKMLSEDFGKIYSFQEIQNRILKISNLNKEGEEKLDKESELREALTYLHSNNLIQYFQTWGEIKITFEGYMKLKTNSFSKEIKEKSIDQILQRIAWIIPILISLIALYFSLKDFPSSTDNNTIQDVQISKDSMH